MGKLLGELVRHEALGFRVGLIEWFFAVVANSGAEGHELVDALDVGGFEALVRPREELEPLEGTRKCVWIRRERLGMGGLIRLLLLLLLAGLREELGVLLEDLEVLLFFLKWGWYELDVQHTRKKEGGWVTTMSTMGSPTRIFGCGGASVPESLIHFEMFFWVAAG